MTDNRKTMYVSVWYVDVFGEEKPGSTNHKELRLSSVIQETSACMFHDMMKKSSGVDKR